MVGKLSGKVCMNMSEADIVNEIVDDILLKINPNILDVAKYPVGLDSRVKVITSMLSSGTQGVTKIGIYGMGGVGKTTLAKALYNQLLQGNFQGFSFLANVRETSGTTIGITSLQQQLINDVLKSKTIVQVHNVDQGTSIIRARISLIKVLVVIDDLEHHKQYESLVEPFDSGSLVIITTRHEELLDSVEVEPRYRFMVNELDNAESLTLFTRHAFRNTKPNKTLMVLTKEILRHAGGLPLALEVFGSYLYKRPEIGWQYFVEKLRQRITNSTIQQRLVISLDALESDDPMLKKMFLDIACFFIGRIKEDVVNIMETYYLYADHNIDILRKRSLLTINSKNQIGMHDLLRDIGREVSCNNSPDEPGKHSRLWASKDVFNVLKNHKGTEAIEGIIYNFDCMDTFSNLSFATEAFKRMSKLRFLHLSYLNITGSFEQKLEDLRWLQWYWCPLKYFPSEFHPQKLVVLELHGSTMTEMCLLKVFEKL
ncbi:TMV resistance protein N-like [Daucus carota subsp. sativus]|uniref:TMV resistance protein N-like n=1 Tax=Daucus carota subsp. sativus TaxID=79200 RepID=UPI00308359CE